MTNESQWVMRIEGALSAHFFQPDGSSRPPLLRQALVGESAIWYYLNL
jgi:hypothetical protein